MDRIQRYIITKKDAIKSLKEVAGSNEVSREDIATTIVVDNQFISDYLNKPVRANVVPVMFRHCWLLFSCHLHNTHSHHYLLPPFSSKSPSLFFTMISPVLSKDWMTGLNQLGTGR